MLAISAITLDLDDTLWPVWPIILRAETAVHAWLAEQAPATARAFDVAGLRRLRQQVAAEQPHQAHDLSKMRLESLRLALRCTGDDPSQAEAAFNVFFAERQRVELYADAAPALARLSSRYPLLALTNGNADLTRTGVAHWFQGAVSAGEFGAGKPDPRIFGEACRRLALRADQVLHAGDDWTLDVDAALAAGLHACWVLRPGTPAAGGMASQQRSHADAHRPGLLTVPDLTTLADRLGC